MLYQKTFRSAAKIQARHDAWDMVASIDSMTIFRV